MEFSVVLDTLDLTGKLFTIHIWRFWSSLKVDFNFQIADVLFFKNSQLMRKFPFSAFVVFKDEGAVGLACQNKPFHFPNGQAIIVQPKVVIFGPFLPVLLYTLKVPKNIETSSGYPVLSGVIQNRNWKFPADQCLTPGSCTILSVPLWIKMIDQLVQISKENTPTHVDLNIINFYPSYVGLFGAAII